MNLSDLKALQASKNWKRFYFLSQNQPGYACAEPIKASLTFTQMDISAAHPLIRTIYFRDTANHLNYMRLDFVIAADCEPHVLGDVLIITCERGVQYIIVAQ